VTDWPAAVSEALGVAVVLGSWGATSRDKRLLTGTGPHRLSGLTA
jgi:hypothetical protein